MRLWPPGPANEFNEFMDVQKMWRPPPPCPANEFTDVRKIPNAKELEKHVFMDIWKHVTGPPTPSKWVNGLTKKCDWTPCVQQMSLRTSKKYSAPRNWKKKSLRIYEKCNGGPCAQQMSLGMSKKKPCPGIGKNMILRTYDKVYGLWKK